MYEQRLDAATLSEGSKAHVLKPTPHLESQDSELQHRTIHHTLRASMLGVNYPHPQRSLTPAIPTLNDSRRQRFSTSTRSSTLTIFAQRLWQSTILILAHPRRCSSSTVLKDAQLCWMILDVNDPHPQQSSASKMPCVNGARSRRCSTILHTGEWSLTSTMLALNDAQLSSTSTILNNLQHQRSSFPTILFVHDPHPQRSL